MRKSIAFAIALSSTMMIAAPASALELRDDYADFRFDPSLGDTETCVALPRSMRDATACKGVDFSGFRDLEQDSPLGKTVGATVAIGEDFRALVIARRTPVGKLDPKLPASIRGYITGLEIGLSSELGTPLRHHGFGAAEWDIVDLGPTRAVRVVIEPKEPIVDRPGLYSGVAYAIIEEQGSHLLLFMTDGAHLAKVRTLAEKSVATIRMQKQELDADAKKPKNGTAFDAGRALGRLIGSAFVVALVVFLVVRATRVKA